jgi:hypothetical protein
MGLRIISMGNMGAIFIGLMMRRIIVRAKGEMDLLDREVRGEEAKL